MDALSEWFDQQTSTPAGSILLFVLVFLTRVAIDQWTQKRARRKAKHKRGTASG